MTQKSVEIHHPVCHFVLMKELLLEAMSDDTSVSALLQHLPHALRSPTLHYIGFLRMTQHRGRHVFPMTHTDTGVAARSKQTKQSKLYTAAVMRETITSRQ
jgi:hypothetical protein